MSGAVINPNQEDENTFLIIFISGEHYKVRVSSAKERQIWMDQLRHCVMNLELLTSVNQSMKELEIIFSMMKCEILCPCSSWIHLDLCRMLFRQFFSSRKMKPRLLKVFKFQNLMIQQVLYETLTFMYRLEMAEYDMVGDTTEDPE